MMIEPRRLNRVVLTLLGLTLVGAGGVGLAVSYDAFGSQRGSVPVISPVMRQYVQQHHGAFWAAASAGCLVLAVLSLAWLRAQVRAPRPANEDLARLSEAGRTTVTASAACRAFAEEIESYDDVLSAGARLHGEDDDAELDVYLKISDEADIAALRQRVHSEAIPHLCGALELRQAQVSVNLRLAPSDARHVA